MNASKRISLLDIALVVITVLWFIGLNTWCGPCKSGMTCHTAGQMLKACALLSIFLSLVHLIPNKYFKVGIDTALVAILVLSMFIPGNIAKLCVMSGMRCRSVMQPWNLGFCTLLIVLASIDFILNLFGTKAEKR